MRLTRGLRRLLEGYLLVLVLFTVLAGTALLLGGDLSATLNAAVLLGLFAAMIAWLVIAYFAGASPSTYIRPDTDKLLLITQSRDLILPQNNPEVAADLKEKLVGKQSDIMIWAGANAGLCFVLGLLFVYLPVVVVPCLLVAIVAIVAVLLTSR